MMTRTRNTFSAWLFIAALFIPFSSVHAATSSAVSVRDYGVLPKVSMMALSPDGDKIAYRIAEGERDMIVVYDLARGKHKAGLNLADSDINMHGLYFATDDELIIIGGEVRRVLGYRGDLDLSTAYAYNVEDNNIRQLLTPGDVIYKGQEGLGRIAGLSPDRKYVYMPAYVADDRMDHSPRMSLMRVDLDSPRRPRVHFKGKEDSLDFFVDAEGEVLVHEIFDNRYNRHKLLVRDGDDWRELYREDTDIRSINVVGMTPARDALVVVGTNSDIGRDDYYTLSLETGEFTNMGFGRDDADIEYTYKGLDRIVWGVRYSGFTPEYRFFDEELDKRVQDIRAMFPEHFVQLRDWSSDWRDLLVYVEGAGDSGTFYKFSADEPPTALAAARPKIKSENIHPIGRMNFRARDGLIIPNLLTIPRERVANMKNLPAVILPHGGPASYDQMRFDWLAQSLASRGYLVVQPQFRGSSGFGIEHEKAGRGEWGGKMQDDLTDAVGVLVKKGIVDPQRICIVGASYGGYAALAGGAFTPELYRCVVSINGVADLEDMIEYEEREHGDDHWIVAYWQKNIGNGEASDKDLKAISPANFAKNFVAPVLLIHGEDDLNVPFKQSNTMYKQLRRAEKDVKLIELKGETHNLMQSETRLEAVEAMVAFVDKYLQPADTQ
ncbi:prolyl oligopeptidase family serine peptidase [Microbulbifer bruguierae]|uniref:Prolyl oligopeptidase family serine peptidase n=1 Tax=Microbulbifer bruguierae TaxID=3029061 RepID=A0ABY8NJZ6_9GAMM|nr:alpha/beta fold hydrolase [Microbulbifer bruguierae]WGL18397.1 prolyl oligopeptidase family serine peptidase [Microbulbifer bruguierae]